MIFDKQVSTKFLTILPNCSVGVTVPVYKCVNSSIYVFGFHGFLCFTLTVHYWAFKIPYDLCKY